jgi:hypothetical protein
MSTYRRTQTGRVILVMMLLPAVAAAAALAAVGQLLTALAVLALFALVAWLFSSLTVEVTGSELRWYFGPGFWKKSVPLADLREVEPVRNKWWYGLGIRYTPHGWLYNVSGLDAVEVRLAGGVKRRIGTDDPAGLVAALRGRLTRGTEAGAAGG